MGQSRIEMSFKLPVKLIKRKNWYVADCFVLDVSSQGETPTKAKKNLAEALSVFFLTCFENGTFDAVLKECGLTLNHGIAKSQKPQTSKSDYVTIPIHLLSADSAQKRCHA